MTTVLAIDSSCEICSVALLCPTGQFTRESQMPRQHAAEILSMVDELLIESAHKISDIKAIAVITGPGSFTGLRIGIAVVQGLAFPWAIPVLPFSSLAAMALAANQQHGCDHVLTAFHSRENEVYFAAWKVSAGKPHCVVTERVMSKNDLIRQAASLHGSWFAAGNAWSDEILASIPLQLIGSDQLIRPCAASILSASKSRLIEEDVIPVEELLPVYIQEQLDYKMQQDLS